MEWFLVIVGIVGGVMVLFCLMAFIVQISKPDPGDDVNDDDNSDGGFDPNIG